MFLLISEEAKIGATKPIFFGFWFPLGRGDSCMCGQVCYKYIVHILKSSKNSIFFASTSNLCRAILPYYLRTYSCALGQIRALKKSFKKPKFETMAKVYLKSWFLINAFDWPKQTVKIGCSILHFFLVRMTITCAELCCQISWEHFPQLCVKFETWRRQLGTMFALVVPSLDNIFMGFADLRSSENWCDETYFFGFWFL